MVVNKFGTNERKKRKLEDTSYSLRLMNVTKNIQNEIKKLESEITSLKSFQSRYENSTAKIEDGLSTLKNDVTKQLKDLKQIHPVESLKREIYNSLIGVVDGKIQELEKYHADVREFAQKAVQNQENFNTLHQKFIELEGKLISLTNMVGGNMETCSQLKKRIEKLEEKDALVESALEQLESGVVV